MDNEIAVQGELIPQTANALPKKKSAHYFGFIRDLVAVVFWFYIITKSFVYDVDILVLKHLSPQYLWLLNYKLLILACVLAITWVLTKNRHIITTTLNTCFFPFILLFWKLPYFVFRQKSWVLAFYVINSIISFFKTIKYNFITTTLFALSFIIAIKSSSPILLWLSISAMFIVLILTYVHRLIIVFRPSSIFQIHKKIFSAIYEQVKKSFSIEENIRIIPIDKLDGAQLQKRTAGLQTSVIFNRVYLFAAKKLRDYQSSKVYIISYVLSLLILMIITVLAFTAINYALYKINVNSFQITTTSSAFDFFYYSFSKFFFNSISEISAFSIIARSASMAEMFLASFLVVIFAVLLFSVRSEKYTAELNSAISSIEKDGKSVETIIIDEYKLSGVYEAIQELVKVRSDLAGFIQKITNAIDNA